MDLATSSTAATLRNSGFDGRVHRLLPQSVFVFLMAVPFSSCYCPQHLHRLDLRTEHAFFCVAGI